MEVIQFSVQGPKLIKLKKFGDERGFFCERYREDSFHQALGAVHFCQENFSRSQPGTLRGLHYQMDLPQAKLVTITAGQVTDIIVDLREQSPTFGQHVSVVLDGNDPAWFWVPVGFAHGFYVMGAQPADLLYKVTNYYNAEGEGGLRWNDPILKLPWPDANPSILSARDQSLPLLRELKPLRVT